MSSIFEVSRLSPTPSPLSARREALSLSLSLSLSHTHTRLAPDLSQKPSRGPLQFRPLRIRSHDSDLRFEVPGRAPAALTPVPVTPASAAAGARARSHAGKGAPPPTTGRMPPLLQADYNHGDYDSVGSIEQCNIGDFLPCRCRSGGPGREPPGGKRSSSRGFAAPRRPAIRVPLSTSNLRAGPGRRPAPGRSKAGFRVADPSLRAVAAAPRPDGSQPAGGGTGSGHGRVPGRG